MEFEFADRKLQRLYVDRSFSAKMAPGLVKAFREMMDTIRDALDERDFYALKSIHFERLSGRRSHLHSMRLNDQYRLIVNLAEQQGGRKRVSIIGIEDYH
jgi:toxin HigB-1